jgi:hypothetical protein
MASQDVLPTVILIEVSTSFAVSGNGPAWTSRSGPRFRPKRTKIDPCAIPDPFWPDTA